MRRLTVLGVLVLGAVLLQITASGTPVAGDDSVAAVTAGINLGTAPTPRVTSPASLVPLRTSAIRNLLALLRLLLLVGAGVVALSRSVPDLQSILQRAGLGRRGPPTTA